MQDSKISKQLTFSPRLIWRNLLPTLIHAVVPYIIYRVVNESLHLSAVNSLLLAALPPVCGLLIQFVRKRQLSVNAIGVFVLVGLAVKTLSALLFHDAHLVVISDSVVGGVYGLLLLGSVLMNKPILERVLKSKLKSNLPKSLEQRAQLEQALQDYPSPRLHRSMLIATAMLGGGLLLLMFINVLFIYELPIATAVLVRSLIDHGLAVLILGAFAYIYFLRTRKHR